MAQSFRLQIAALLQHLATAPASGTLDALLDVLVDFDSGTDDGESDKHYFARRTLSGSSNETLDLAGSLTDLEGNTVTFAEITDIIVLNENTVNNDDLAIGPNSSNGFGTGGFWADASDRSRVEASVHAETDPGLLLMRAPRGVTVTAGTGDLLYVENLSSNSVDYLILIIGRSS